jgi:hypothetical protein
VTQDNGFATSDGARQGAGTRYYCIRLVCLGRSLTAMYRSYTYLV